VRKSTAFDPHGRIAFSAARRERLEELVRYCARPPLANDRLEKRADGRYVQRLKGRWRDGTAQLRRFEGLLPQDALGGALRVTKGIQTRASQAFFLRRCACVP
jgi:hypothetical protein